MARRRTGAIPLNGLREMAKSRCGEMVKAVVDVDREIMAVDGELHADFAHPRGAHGSNVPVDTGGTQQWQVI